MATSIQYVGSRAEIRQIAYRLKAMLTGQAPDTHGVARGFMLAIGFGALSDIRDAFIVKARGGTDEMGITWPKHTRAYLAYGRRFGRGEKIKLIRAAGLDPKLNRFAPGGKQGLLTKEQLAAWRKVYSSMIPRFYMATGSIVHAKAKAASIAWATIKKDGARTKLEIFGDRQAEILRDTGVLLASISPGQLNLDGPSTTYQKPSGEGGEEQIFEIRPGNITVGTNVAYAAVHNYGHDEKPTMPRRQFLPDSDAQIPDAWWANWLGIAERALESGAAIMFGRDAA